MSSNNSTASGADSGGGGGSTHRPSNLSLAERIRLSREAEERERRVRAQEDLHRLQEQSSQGDASSYAMPLNDLSGSGGSGSEARSSSGPLEPEESVAPPLEPEGVLAPIEQAAAPRRLRPRPAETGASAGSSVFSGAVSAVTGTLSAMTGYTGGDEDNDSDSREDEMDQSLAAASRARQHAAAAGAAAAGENEYEGDDGDGDGDDGNSLTSYEKNVALHTAVQLGALTAEAGNDDMSEVASTYDVGSLSGFESAAPSVAGGRSTAGLSTGGMSRRTMGTKTSSIGALETIGEEDSQALLAAEEGMSRQNSGRRSSESGGSSGAASRRHRDGAMLQAAAAGAAGRAMAGPGLLERVASAYSRSTMASGSSRSRWSTTDDEYTAAYTSASESDDYYTSDYSYSNPSESSRSFYSNPRAAFRNGSYGASTRSFYTTSSASESADSSGESSRPSLLDAVGEKLSRSLRSVGTQRTESESSTSNWGSNSDLLTGSQRIPTKTGKRIRQADMMIRRRWAIPASIVLAVLLFLAIYIGLQSRKTGDSNGLDFGDGGGRGIYGDDDAVLFQGYEGGPTSSPAGVVSQVPTSEVMIHNVPNLLDDENQFTEQTTTTTTTEVATAWGVPAGQPTPDPAMLPSLVQGADGTWGWKSGMPTIKLDSSFFDSIQSETVTTTTSSTTTGYGGGSDTETDAKLTWSVPAGSPTPDPALLSQVSFNEDATASMSWNFPEGESHLCV